MKRILLTFVSIMIALSTLLHAEVPTKNSVTKLYVATFNRAPDAAGLDYWLNSSGLQLEEIAQSFFDQPETQDKYPEGSTNVEFVEAVYNNLFNRDPDQAGSDYWVGELNSGAVAKPVFILAVINGALGTDATILENKTTVGLAFADAGLDDVELAIEIMSGITEDPATVTAALETLPDDEPAPGACVTIPRLGTGDVFTIRTTTLTEPSTVVDVETTITSFDSTTATYATVTTGEDIMATGEKTETFTIANNYLDLTEIVSTDSTTVQGFSIDTDTTIEITPYLRTPIDTVCEGTVLEQTYELKTTATTSGFTVPATVSNHTTVTTIESVDQVKTTVLGTFTAVRIKIEDENGKTISWIDTASGHFIAGEYFNASGIKESTQELISHN